MIVSAFSFFMGTRIGQSRTQAQAVANGCGEWISKNDSPHFKWNDQKEEKQ